MLVPLLKCLTWRMHFAAVEERQALRKLQGAGKVAVAKKRNHKACLERLQGYLRSLQKKVEAQSLLNQLRMERLVSSRPRYVRVALRAVHLRQRLWHERQEAAAVRIQQVARGGLERGRCRELRKEQATRLILCACGRFAAQQQLLNLRQQGIVEEALELWRSVLATFHERSSYAPSVLYNRASLKIAAMWRGRQARKQVTRLRWSTKAQTLGLLGHGRP